MWYKEKNARERALSSVERISWLLSKMYFSIPATSYLDWRMHKRSPKIGMRFPFESFVGQISET